MTLTSLFITGWIAAALLMLMLWGVQYRTHNAGIVDIAWAFVTAILGIYFALMSDIGYTDRQLLLSFMVGCWGLRLGIYLARRVLTEVEDGRYRQLRATLGDNIQPFLFGFFQIQALWSVLFALPIWAAARSPYPELGMADYAGLALWLFALISESIADLQLHRFRSDPANHRRVCDQGLWRYSRHPNYFFEWLHWWAYVLIGYGSGVWWLTWAGVAVMLVFLLKVTGIPYTEQQSLRSRGDAYRRYQRSTSIFIPLPPKNIEGVST